MRNNIVLILIFLLSAYGSAARVWAAGEKNATFSAVEGKVKVFTPLGHSRKALLNHVVYAGDSIQVGADSKASVSLPDGSSLDLESNSRITITSLTQPSVNTKNFLFKLAVGKLFAQVRKLLSSQSSFEIEAGGVVCGVRGTYFSMLYSPDTKGLNLSVFNGVVGASSGGATQLFSQGQGGRFLGGRWDGKILNAGSPPKTGNGNNGGKGSSGGSTGNGSNGNNGSNSGNNGGSNGNGGGDNGSSNGNSGENNGGTNETGEGNNGGNNTGSNTCLTDLGNQFQTGILINGDNNLAAAQQSVQIHLVVPPGEAVP